MKILNNILPILEYGVSSLKKNVFLCSIHPRLPRLDRGLNRGFLELSNKVLSLTTIFLLLFYQITSPLQVLAQESTPSASQEEIVQSTPEPSPTPSPFEIPTSTPEPSPIPSPTPSLDESLTTPPATQSALIDTSTTENQSSVSLAPPSGKSTLMVLQQQQIMLL